jgi:DNA-binding LacI/PurR family transcriptional regulator
MGYRPNPLVSALMSARARGLPATANLALLKVGEGKEVLGFSAGAFEQAEKYGYPIEEFVLKPPRMTPERLRGILFSRGIRGIILLPVPVAGSDLHFDFEGFATVAIGHSIVHDHLPRVTSDAYLRTLDALRHLEVKGFTRIGIIHFPEVGRRFHHGMRAAGAVARHVISRRMSVQSHMFKDADEYSRLGEGDRRQLRSWIRRHRLQVVMSQMAFMPEILGEVGFRIPKDLGYLHLHYHPDPGIACMDQMCRFAGQKAVDMAVAAINRNDFSLPQHPYILSVPSIWRDGASIPSFVAKQSGT